MQREIIAWYRKNKRDLPWRKTTPWGVMVSEYMLQQTPVNRVLPVWEAWMKRWPTPKSLATSKKSDALKMWGRLGYPRRAVRLHEAAVAITDKHNGKIPSTYEELRKLPGIGDYTAAAIQAFAFDKKSLVLDINIRRLFARAIDGVSTPPLHITQTERIARTELIPKDASTWAAATMELGALICTAKNPKCDICPIKASCRWRLNNYPESQTIKKRTQAWHGTDRQCRGRIIAHLRNHDTATKKELTKLWDDQSQFERSLESLLTDKLIQKQRTQYSLAD